MEEAIASALDLLDVERIPRWADALLGFPKHLRHGARQRKLTRDIDASLVDSSAHLGEEASPRPYHTLVIICLRCLALATAQLPLTRAKYLQAR